MGEKSPNNIYYKRDSEPNIRQSSRSLVEDNRTEKAKRVKHTTRKPTETSNLGGSRGLIEPELSTIEHAWAGPWPSAHM